MQAERKISDSAANDGIRMNEDGWYTSLVGKSGKPLSGIQKLADRKPRRETILVGGTTTTKS
jgi:hypothetical protein